MTFQSGDNEVSLWNEQDGMYYDAIEFGPGNSMQLPVRSLVGLIPLYATLVLEPATINRFPGFKKRLEWFIDNRPEVSDRTMANMKSKLICPIDRPWIEQPADFVRSQGTWGASASCSGQQGSSSADSREDAR